MAAKLKYELRGKTLALIKPDAYGKTGGIIDTIAGAGFYIVCKKKMDLWTPEMAALFYEQHRDQPFFEALVKHMASGPVTALVLQKRPATTRKTVLAWRELMGATDPSKAATGTIRHTFWNHQPLPENVVHGSDSPEAAKREIKLVFSPFELLGK